MSYCDKNHKLYLYRPQGFFPEDLDYLGIKPLGSCQRSLNGYHKFKIG